MKRYKYYHTLFFIIMAAIIVFSIEGASPEEKKEAEKGCLSCHPELQKKLSSQIVHSPAGKEKCVECHNPHASKHKKLLTESSSSLCYKCHQKQKEKFKKGHVHLPVKNGECVKCHNPHASNIKNLLITNRNEVCFTCHTKKTILSRKNIHKPLEGGDCLKCHNPHASDDEFLLVRNSIEICNGCHSIEDSKLQKAHSNSLSKNTNCLSCHNPHSSNHNDLMREFSHMPFVDGECSECHVTSQNKTTMEMKKKGKAFCLDCHEEIEKQFQKVFSHLQGNKNNICLECHSPHVSDYKKLKKSRDDKICYTCHTDSKRRVKGNDPMYKYKHPDIEKCTSCHEPHGSDYRLLLKSDENASCEECHKTQGKFTHPVGDKCPDPRTKRGMTCVTCHNPMGAEAVNSIRFGRQKKLCVQCHVSKK